MERSTHGHCAARQWTSGEKLRDEARRGCRPAWLGSKSIKTIRRRSLALVRSLLSLLFYIPHYRADNLQPITRSGLLSFILLTNTHPLPFLTREKTESQDAFRRRRCPGCCQHRRCADHQGRCRCADRYHHLRAGVRLPSSTSSLPLAATCFGASNSARKRHEIRTDKRIVSWTPAPTNSTAKSRSAEAMTTCASATTTPTSLPATTTA